MKFTGSNSKFTNELMITIKENMRGSLKVGAILVWLFIIGYVLSIGWGA